MILSLYGYDHYVKIFNILNILKIKNISFERKYTIKNLKREFNTEEKCFKFLFEKKFKDIKFCPKCGICGKFYLVMKKKRYVGSLFLTKGTIFYKSSTPLTLWFHAMFLFNVSKNGVSAKELKRQLGVTYKIAWRMANKIRSLMESENQVVSEIVEIDETYIGGKKIISIRIKGF